MKFIYLLLLLISTTTEATAGQINKTECEKVWAEGEILHDFDELEVVGGNYRPRSYIRYNGSIYYGILTVKSSTGKNPDIWVAMNCWNSSSSD